MKRIFKENKVLFVLLTLIIIASALILFGLVRYFYYGNGNSAYGMRLYDIEDNPLNSNLESDIRELLKESSVNDVTVDLKGKIVYLTIDLSELMSMNDAKSIAIKSLEAFTENEKKYYDIQFILTAKKLEDENNLYPTMGYKNSNSSQIVWIRE